MAILREVSELCDARGVLLILDEIQTGCGRTGRFTAPSTRACHRTSCAWERAGGRNPGWRDGGWATRGRQGDAASHTSTFGGNPLACAGALIVLSWLTSDALARIGELGDAFRRRLARISSPLVSEVRGAAS